LVSSLVTLLVGGALATGYWFALWPLTTLAVYLLLLNSAENGHSWLLSLIVAFSLIQALLGISQSLFHWPVFSLALPRLFESNRGPLGFILPGFSRMVSLGSGTFRHPNGLGGLLALALPICFGWLLESPRSFRRLLPFAILVIGLLMSYSRGGWLGGAVGCILAYWAARPRASRPLVTLLESPRSFPRLLPFTILATGLLTSYLGGGWVGGAVGCILAYWASRPWASRPWVPLLSEGVLLMAALSAPSIAAYYDATQNVTSRVATWHYGFTYWLQHPASIPFGAGFGSFQQTILMQRIWQGGRILSALHSGFLQILLEMGIAGLLVFGWFLITTIRPFAIDRRPGWQTWALGGLVGFLVSQMFDNALFGLVAGVCAFALAACLRRADARHEAG
ncbi:MAG: O-antigen ligase family protein, partial [candidate division NC10 bacterium]